MQIFWLCIDLILFCEMCEDIICNKTILQRLLGEIYFWFNDNNFGKDNSILVNPFNYRTSCVFCVMKESLENTVWNIFDVVIGVYSFHVTVIKTDRQNLVTEFCRCNSHGWIFSLISERDC